MFTIFILVAFLPAPVASLAVAANDTTGHAGCCIDCDGDALFREPAGCLAKKPCGKCAHITHVDKCDIDSLLGSPLGAEVAPQDIKAAIKDYMADNIADKTHVTGDELKRLAQTIVDRHKKEKAAEREKLKRMQAERLAEEQQRKEAAARDKPKEAARALHERLKAPYDGAIILLKGTEKLAKLAAESLGRAEEDAKDAKEDRLSENVEALKGLADRVHALEEYAGSFKGQLAAEAAVQSKKEVSDLLDKAAKEVETHLNFISQAGKALGKCVGNKEDGDVTVLDFMKQAEGLLLQFKAVAMRIDENTKAAWAESKKALDELEGRGTGGKRRRTMARGVRKMLSAVRRAAARFST